MDQWTNHVGNLAIVWTIGLFLSGCPICYKIYKEGLVGEISALPFLSAFINCFIMFLYGILINNFQIITVNAIGFNLEAIYIVIYLYYTQNKKKLIHQILFLLLISTSVCFYSFYFEENTKTASYAVGYLGSMASVIMFGSPLASIRAVMKSQSTEALSFPLCLANFGCSSLWAFYGFLLDDKFILIPNIIGSILGFAQVSLFAKFPSQSISTRSKFKSDDPIM